MAANQKGIVEYPCDTERNALRVLRQKIVGVAAFHVRVVVGASAPVFDLVCCQIVEYSRDIERTGPIKKGRWLEENSYPTFSSSLSGVAVDSRWLFCGGLLGFGCCGGLQYGELGGGGLCSSDIAVDCSWLRCGWLLGWWSYGGLRCEELRSSGVTMDWSWFRCGGLLRLGCCSSLQCIGLRGSGLCNIGVTADCAAVHYVAAVIWRTVLQWIVLQCILLRCIAWQRFTLQLTGLRWSEIYTGVQVMMIKN